MPEARFTESPFERGREPVGIDGTRHQHLRADELSE